MNADDLGMSDGVNRGIREAHETGIVTSTSLMVDRPAAKAGVELVRGSRLSVGLHAVLDGVAPDEAARELERQRARFVELVGAPPTHVDSHHHVHRGPALLPAFAAFAERHALLLRDHSPARHCGLFYGRWDDESHPKQVSAKSLLGILDQIGDGVTEIGCHPGYAVGLTSAYLTEREAELDTLTDPRVRDEIEALAIRLATYADYRVP